MSTAFTFEEELELELELAQLAEREAKPVTRYARYQSDPHGYAHDVLKVSLTDDQSEILQSVVDNRYTLAKASHAVGKTFNSAVAANWWFDCWAEHICYITAPTWPQALGLTFKEVKTMRRLRRLPGDILDKGIVRDTDKILEASHYIRALNAEKGEGFQGEHAAPILIIIEEGVGVARYIWEATKGLMSHAECRLLVIGNPTDDAGDFGTAADSPEYTVFSINGLDHPNIVAELQCQPPPIPKAISLLWVSEMLTTECERVDSFSEDAFEWYALPAIEGALRGNPIDVHGEKWIYKPSGTFQARVLGEFPSQAEQQVIPKAWLKGQPVYELDPAHFPEIGCDIARYGDDRTTIFVRRGPCLLKGRELRQMDNVEVATALKDEALEAANNYNGPQWVASTVRFERIRWSKSIPIKIDTTGGLGTGPHDILRSEGYNVYGVNSATKALDPEQFKNKRSELWWHTRIRVQEKRFDMSRLDKATREKLQRELGTPKYKALGQKIVDPKEVTKKKLGASPDLADGCNLAFYQAPREGQPSASGQRQTSGFRMV